MTQAALAAPAPLSEGSLPLLGAYGLLGLPLAFVALPIYVHVPKLYADFGLSLSAIGAVLLLARIWDAVIDPLIGALGDRWGLRRAAIFAAVPLLTAGLLGLLHPPAGEASVARLLGMLLIVYLGYSLAAVNHHAWGAELSSHTHLRTRIVAVREGFALLGVVLAAALPSFMGATLAEGLGRLSWLFVVILLLSAAALIAVPQAPVSNAPALRGTLIQALFKGRFLRLLGVFALSGIAAAIPASLVLFFVADVLQAGAYSGGYLALYFVAGAAGLPLWVWLSRRIGKLRAWGAGMALSILVFVWAGTLGAGDLIPFGVICALSGLALGADLALPPSALADVIEREGGGAGSYFGWWNFVSKLNLALAAGLSLPLLAWLGYVPGSTDAQGHVALAWVYAGVPAILKCMALALLWRQRVAIESA
ncbi:MFS transporter [Uliginosibacterium sp. 31-16]|uniref:MFS transporter n=1 Tax=Uliginosibacterium sp. 31-16 TaxID=3068315 RepID=UPI00273F6CC6|nr:MFS transporter [Uliginosibacterium sp. 31-16]MDP5238154.1 MFS transporter [Uliginosibacterium sp. 31-16]